MALKLSGLWLHTEFRRLWAGQASSLFGSQLLFIALPLTAVIVLDATPFQMGVVTAMGGVPALLGLWMGAWVDRRKRLPVIVLADIGRAVLIGVIPLAHLLNVLTIEIVYAVSFGIGAMSILFQIAYRSFLPSIVRSDELVEANSKLEFATSSAGSIGPAIGGFLIQLLTAPFALLVGTGSYAISALLFRRINANESVATGGAGETASTSGIREGIAFFRSSGILIGLAASQSTLVAFSSAFEAVSFLYLVRVLGLSAGTIGIFFGAASAGLFAGAWIGSRYSNRLGVGRITTLGLAAAGIGDLALPLATGPTVLIAMTLIAGGIFTQAGAVLYNVGQVSIKQAITPDRLQGRVTSVMIVLSRAAVPVGGLMGGILGEFIGLRETLFVGVSGMVASLFWLIIFKVWSIRSLEGRAEQQPT